MATGEAPAPAPGDPYATSKANLRDTVKWLAGIFGALAAAVIAGAPISGLGAIQEAPAFLPSALALLLGFGFISTALIVTLRLLRSDLLYASDLDPRVDISKRPDREEIARIRANISNKAVDLLPAGYNGMQSFLEAIDKAIRQAQDTAAKIARLDAQEPRDDAQIATKLTQYAAEQGVVRDYRAAQQRVMAYASYLRFYDRLQRSAKWLLLLGTGALASLAVFGIEAQPPKEAKSPTVVVIPLTESDAAATQGSIGSESLEPIRFAAGSSEVSPQGRQAIENAGHAARDRQQATLVVIARADGGVAVADDSLARARGEAVKRLLIESGGVSPGQVVLAETPHLSAEHSHLNGSVSLHWIDLAPRAPGSGDGAGSSQAKH